MKYHYKIEKIRGFEYKFAADWIYALESEEHWRLYWYQQKTMQHFVRKGENVLEIGVGSGFTANYLKSKGVHVTTLDIDKEKQPDIVANVVQYQFFESYEHILAFEVFEHIPFVEFKNVISKISRACKKTLFLSVPRNERTWFHMDIYLPWIGRKQLRLTTLRGKTTEPAHFWEIDDGTVSEATFEKMLKTCDLDIISKAKQFSRMFYTLKPTRY